MKQSEQNFLSIFSQGMEGSMNLRRRVNEGTKKAIQVQMNTQTRRYTIEKQYRESKERTIY